MLKRLTRRRQPYTDAITNHPGWPEALRRVRKMSSHQLNESFIALACDLIRQREQLEHYEDIQDALGEELLTLVGLEAIRRETALRAARNQDTA